MVIDTGYGIVLDIDPTANQLRDTIIGVSDNFTVSWDIGSGLERMLTGAWCLTDRSAHWTLCS